MSADDNDNDNDNEIILLTQPRIKGETFIYN